MKTVSIAAVEKRVDRALSRDGLRLRKARFGTRAYSELGHYYIVDTHTNALDAGDIDLIGWAKELRVLSPNDEINDE